jgi:hypothetical protein
MMVARSGLHDHRRIAWSKKPWLRFRPEEASTLHQRSVLAIESILVQLHSVQDSLCPTVVVTHHAPHRHSMQEQFGSDLLAAAYGSDLSEMIVRTSPACGGMGTHTAQSIMQLQPPGSAAIRKAIPASAQASMQPSWWRSDHGDDFQSTHVQDTH